MKLDDRSRPALNRETLRTYLDRLDRGATPRAADLRVHARHRYRLANLRADVLDGDGFATESVRVCGRNLSAGGISFLHTRLLYPGTPCRIHLVGPHHHRTAALGRVRHCRYVMTSGSVYEVGLEFDQPVDVTALVPQTRLVRVLVADADAGVADLIGRFLSDYNVALTTGPQSPEELLACVAAAPQDVVLLDLEDTALQPFETSRRLRDAGFVGPIIGLTIQLNTDATTACEQHGLSGCLRKPLLRSTVRTLFRDLTDRPLVSTYAHRADLAPLIDAFVAGLTDRIHDLAVALRNKDRAQLDRLLHTLRGQAGSYGFATISDAAADVQLLLMARTDPAELRSAMDELLHLCLTARPVTTV